jgi:hypothetical protein
MRFQKGVPRPANAGRRAGTPNKRSQDIELFARSILEAPEYRENLRQKSETGTLEPHLETLLYSYAYGKPAQKKVAPGEQPTDDAAFMQEFLAAVLKHVTAADARTELREIIRKHVGADRLRLVS